ncbi:ANL_collapsed_G0053590.mRNA.1.CDS.1 [Saccharomyces cerevisiae]|nr:ANL_collapsed_G0053590.mRNA.1.CDS.1 [Saccharomyces cerevisiae]
MKQTQEKLTILVGRALKCHLFKWINFSILSFSRKYGVPEDELFQTIDLFEKKDPAIVFQTLKSLSRYANKKHPDRFPVLGPQLSTKKPRPPVKSKPKHLQDGTGWSTFEYGYMKGASQATKEWC